MNYYGYLEHHGIKGQKWGVRRYQNSDGSLTAAGRNRYNENYSADQRSRDRGVYGRGGVRRINRSMNKGARISEARSKEADRIYKHRRIGVAGGQVGSIVGGVGGAIVGYKLSNKILQKYGTGDFLTDTLIKSAITSGSAKAGSMLGRIGGQSIGMISGGYSLKKFRYG